MPNVNYRKGRAKEYRIMARLRMEGYNIVLRSAGSHSAVDVIGIRDGDEGIFGKRYVEIKLIQSKPKSMSKAQKEKLEEKYKWLNTTEAVISFTVE